MDLVGTMFIIGCVLLINLGSDDANTETGVKDDKPIAIMMALLVGFLFAFNTLNLGYCIETVGFNPSQLNFDGGFLIGLILIPFFYYEKS